MVRGGEKLSAAVRTLGVSAQSLDNGVTAEASGLWIGVQSGTPPVPPASNWNETAIVDLLRFRPTPISTTLAAFEDLSMTRRGPALDADPQLKSDLTSCRSANANQMRLFLHTAAYWLVWRLRRALPQTTTLRTAELATLRLRLIKVAARVVETAILIRSALASACPDAALFQHVALSLRAASP